MQKTGNFIKTEDGKEYEVLEKIAHGGFSEVCLGRDVLSGKNVALKIFYFDNGISAEEQIESNLREICALKKMQQLEHQHIIGYLGWASGVTVGSRGKATVLVLELASRGELFAYAKAKPFSQKAAVTLFHQLMSGVKAMHDIGFTHRDLKPENILFDKDYVMKITDFGFCNKSDKLRTNLGTKVYCAPEIQNKYRYTNKVDIFSAGVVLFIMVGGFPPWAASEKGDWWFDKMSDGKHKLFWMAHERAMKFSPELKTLINGMLNPDPEKRFNMSQVMSSKFWNSKCLTKDELKSDLKTRWSKLQK